MLARLSAFVIWALVAATAVFWGLRLFVAAPPAPPGAVAVGDATGVRVDLTRLLGAAPVAPAAALAEASSRFKLLGIMAPPGGKLVSGSSAAQGVALIAVDGKLARAYRVGAALDGELVLLSVSLRSAAIGPARGTPTVTLDMPALPVAATGTRPTPGQAPATPQVAPPVQFQPAPSGPGGPVGALPVPPREPGAPTE